MGSKVDRGVILEENLFLSLFVLITVNLRYFHDMEMVT